MSNFYIEIYREVKVEMNCKWPILHRGVIESLVKSNRKAYLKIFLNFFFKNPFNKKSPTCGNVLRHCRFKFVFHHDPGGGGGKVGPQWGSGEIFTME